jgi:hypothetical protein
LIEERFFSMIPTVMIFWIDLALSCPTVKLPVLRARLWPITVARGRQIVEEQGLKLLDEDIE